VNLKRGDLVFVFDPVRGTGSGSGHRGLCIVDSANEDEVHVRPIASTHQLMRAPLSAIHIVFTATFVAKELLK
jgi:hypothetical protein